MRGPFEFIIAIVVLSLLVYAVMAHFESKRERRRARQQDEGANADFERLAQLEERIRVLERIVTDDDLKQRFKNL